MAESRHAGVLLCGGIGSGKTMVGRMLAFRGATVIHADNIGHQVLEPEGDAFPAVAQMWPQTVVAGRIDRAGLAGIVFGDPVQLARLEAATHPAIRDRIAMMVEAAGAGPVVVEVPLLSDFLGPGWERVVVDSPGRVRRERLRLKGMAESDISSRMAAQPSRREWLEAADFVVENNGSLEELEDEVGRLLAWMEGRSGG